MAIRALSAQIAESAQLVLTMMSWLGDTPTSWPINSELADVAGIPAPRGQPLFRFLRYDIRLEQDWLARELGVSIEQRTLERYQLIDAPENIPALYELGARAAERQITRDHLVVRPKSMMLG
jgi:uncharacterized protein